MSDEECWLCESPEVAYVDALTLPWCAPCWDRADAEAAANARGAWGE